MIMQVAVFWYVTSCSVLEFWRNLMAWRSWVRHCAARRKVSGSFSDGVTGIFHLYNPSDRTMTLGLTQVSNRNEYHECFMGGGGGKGGRCVGLTTLPPSCADGLEVWGASTSWKPQGLSRDCFSFT
jgi:hypothetical protein